MLRKVLCLLLVLGLVVAFVPFGAAAQGGDVTVTIFHVNDIHGRFKESSSGIGLAKVASIVKSVDNAILLDAGDTIHGQTLVTLDRGYSAVRIMNAVGFSAMVPGNHDFNYGYQQLLELAELAEFEIICANVLKDGAYILPPYTVLEAAGKKIGVFGLATPETLYKSHPDNTRGLVFQDTVIAARNMVSVLNGLGVDVIIALAHLGQDQDSYETSLRVAREVSGIDIIIDGHSHHPWDQVQSVGNTLIVMASEYLKELGRIDITFGPDGKVIVPSVISKAATAGVVPDPEVLRIIAEVEAAQNVILNRVIGHSSVFLQGERNAVRGGETNLGNLITDAMRWGTGADIAITNGGGIRASIPAGEITVGHVVTVLPFGNFVVTKRMTGREIVAALEHGLSAWPAPSGAFPQVSGLEFSWFDGRVFNVKVNGRPLVPSRYYTVATNDFLAAGGDGYTVFGAAAHVGDFAGLDEMLIEYIQHHGTIAPQVRGYMRVLKAWEMRPAR